MKTFKTILILVVFFVLTQSQVRTQKCGTNQGQIQSPNYPGQCSCLSSHYWNSQQQSCILDCGDTTGQIFIYVITPSGQQCACQDNYRWDDDLKTCVEIIKCSNDPRSTGIELQEINECQCIPNHYWDSQEQKCVPNCFRKLADGNLDQVNLKCGCRSPAKWNDTTFQCYLDCQDVDRSTGQQESPEVCQCSGYSNWNPGTLSCDLDCSRVPFALSSQNGDSCVCQDDFQWKQGRCIRICDDSDYELSPIIQDGTCQCKDNAKWSKVLGKCVAIDCSGVSFASGPGDQNGECKCVDNYKWSGQYHACIIQDCKALTNQQKMDLSQADQNYQNVYECPCEQGYQWSYKDAACQIDCSLDSRMSTGRNVGLHVCQCQSLSFWDKDQSKCTTICGKNNRIGELQQIEQYARGSRCKCAPGFIHDNQNNCVRDCRSDNNANGRDNTNSSICKCKDSFKWQDQACALDCSTDSSIYNDSPNDQDSCSCKGQALFDQTFSKCLPACVSDPLADQDELNNGQCVCKSNAGFNTQTASCQCYDQFDEEDDETDTRNLIYKKKCIIKSASGFMIGGIVGGVIISGGMAGGVIFYKKRKQIKQVNDDKVVDIQDSVESQKQVCDV